MEINTPLYSIFRKNQTKNNYDLATKRASTVAPFTKETLKTDESCSEIEGKQDNFDFGGSKILNNMG